MNKEELIGKLQMVYIGDKNALNEMVGYYDGLKKINKSLKQENKEQSKKIGRLETIIQKQKEVIDRINIFIDNHNKIAGKLYYKYNNKYLLSNLKEDIRDILKEVK